LRSDPTDCFPSAHAPQLTDGKWGAGLWVAPMNVPVARSTFLGGNVGARTTAVVDAYRCADNTRGQECGNGPTLLSNEDPGFDNLLMKLELEPDGRVVRAELFWTQEYRIGIGPPNLRAPPGVDDSWVGGRIVLGPIAAGYSAPAIDLGGRPGVPGPASSVTTTDD
jgi:hypothetical protein